MCYSRKTVARRAPAGGSCASAEAASRHGRKDSQKERGKKEKNGQEEQRAHKEDPEGDDTAGIVGRVQAPLEAPVDKLGDDSLVILIVELAHALLDGQARCITSGERQRASVPDGLQGAALESEVVLVVDRRGAGQDAGRRAPSAGAVAAIDMAPGAGVRGHRRTAAQAQFQQRPAVCRSMAAAEALRQVKHLAIAAVQGA